MKNPFSQEACVNNSSTASTGANPVLFTGSAPSVFSNEEFGSVRVIVKDGGDPLFCLKDVCDCLDLDDTGKVAGRIDRDELTRLQVVSDGQNRIFIFVTESGLYDVILGSRSNEKTKPFKKWVTSEVLPSIRKTGSYSVARPSYQIEDPIARAQTWIEEEKERIALRDQNNEQRHVIKQQSDMIDVMLPKAKAWEDEMSTAGWYSGSVAAKIIYGNQSNMGRNNLYKFLRKKGVLLKKEEHNMPVDTYVKKGWVKTVWIYDEHKKKAVPAPLFSKKGIKEIHNMIIQDVCPVEDLFY